MAITKIEDLDRYIFVEKGVLTPTEYDKLDAGAFKFSQGRWCDFDQVEELVNHLQSKIVKWRSADDVPNSDDNFSLSKSLILVCSSFEFTGLLNGHYFFNENKFSHENVKYWCYIDDLLKTLPEVK